MMASLISPRWFRPIFLSLVLNISIFDASQTVFDESVFVIARKRISATATNPWSGHLHTRGDFWTGTQEKRNPKVSSPKKPASQLPKQQTKPATRPTVVLPPGGPEQVLTTASAALSAEIAENLSPRVQKLFNFHDLLTADTGIIEDQPGFRVIWKPAHGFDRSAKLYDYEVGLKPGWTGQFGYHWDRDEFEGFDELGEVEKRSELLNCVCNWSKQEDWFEKHVVKKDGKKSDTATCDIEAVDGSGVALLPAGLMDEKGMTHEDLDLKPIGGGMPKSAVLEKRKASSEIVTSSVKPQDLVQVGKFSADESGSHAGFLYDAKNNAAVFYVRVLNREEGLRDFYPTISTAESSGKESAGVWENGGKKRGGLKMQAGMYPGKNNFEYAVFLAKRKSTLEDEHAGVMKKKEEDNDSFMVGSVACGSDAAEDHHQGSEGAAGKTEEKTDAKAEPFQQSPTLGEEKPPSPLYVPPHLRDKKHNGSHKQNLRVTVAKRKSGKKAPGPRLSPRVKSLGSAHKEGKLQRSPREAASPRGRKKARGGLLAGEKGWGDEDVPSSSFEKSLGSGAAARAARLAKKKTPSEA